MSTAAAQPGALRYCGREFTPSELDHIRHLTTTLPTRRAIADAVCDHLGWQRPDGRRKDMTARVALNRMAADGHINLPPPRNRNGNGRLPRYHTPPLPLDLDPHPAPATLDQLRPLHLALVTTKTASRQWRDLIATHHYLGYTPFAGAQLRYLVHSPHHGIIAALGFAASAWKCAPRDTHIGWDPPTRKANLHLIVGNARFLILPHLHIPNLASHLLAHTTKQLPHHWHATYGYTPVLLETFVETRFTAASYRAANWIHIGHTQGRGKQDRTHQHALPIKDIYLYPLHRNYRRILTTPR